MDSAELSVMNNLVKNTGKSLEEWIAIVKNENFDKHAQILKFLKEEHQFTHGFANFVALKARGADANSVEDKDGLVDKQYKGKEHLRRVYDRLILEILTFGSDVEIAPKNAYVSLKRKKQFATLQPATKTRFEIGLNLKPEPAQGRLEVITSASAMCSHKINIPDETGIDEEVLGWLRAAYNKAG
jgi:predicted transport protein